MLDFADWRISSHRIGSSIIRKLSFTFLLSLFSANTSMCQRLFMKCLASGMMNQTWFSWPMSDDSSFWLNVRLFLNRRIFADQAIHFSGGREMVSRLESISQSMKVMVSFRPPSAIIFLINAGSGRLVGLQILARRRKMMKRAMRTAWDALATIPQLLLVSNAAHAPSLM